MLSTVYLNGCKRIVVPCTPVRLLTHHPPRQIRGVHPHVLGRYTCTLRYDGSILSSVDCSVPFIRQNATIRFVRSDWKALIPS